jgi:excisionase family DNA binding protein
LTNRRKGSLSLVDKHEYGRGRPVSPAQSGPFLDAREAGEYLGLGERFARRLVAERRIRFHKFGKYVRIAVPDLDEYIAASAIEAKR